MLIQKTDLPPISLLSPYKDCYTDCFTTTVAGTHALPAFITHFFTSPLFRPERLLLRLTGYPASNKDLTALTEGRSPRFGCWEIEDQTETEMLLAVQHSPIKTWFMVQPATSTQTNLFFGSALRPKDGQTTIPAALRLLTGPHQLYAKILLRSAAGSIAPHPQSSSL